MRRIKEVLRLSALGTLSTRQIASAAQMKRTTVRDYQHRARAARLDWSEAQHLSDDVIESMLFSSGHAAPTIRPMPDWQTVHRERARPHVTLRLLWEEYRAEHPDGYGYTQFCAHYHRYTETLEVSMRQVHVAGDKLFVDYCGTTMSVVDATTGEVRQAAIFVAVLGASNYTYAEATWSETLPDWIGAHTRAMDFLGGVPRAIVPDNLKSGVTKASYYDPVINPTYQRWAEHYGVAILPTRVRRPRDKPKVEAGVQLVERWIIARLRNRTFFSLTELNEAIASLVTALNARAFRVLDGSRASWFAALDQPALGPLPGVRYEYETWKKAKVNIDYHIAYDDHFYSIPFTLVRKVVELRATARMIEVFHRGARVAVHQRSYRRYAYTTCPEHMPPHHRWHAEWTPERLLSWARTVGDDVERFCAAVMRSRQHPEQGFRACLGIMRLEKKVGRDRLTAACTRALAISGLSFSCVRSILERGQDHLPLPGAEVPAPPVIVHENLRGSAYYRHDELEERHAASSHD